MADAAVVVTTHNALPWIEQCLESVAGTDTVVVDNASTDGTAAFVRERFPAVRVAEQGNLGLAAGWARGLEEAGVGTEGQPRWVLVLNADAWLVGNALARMVAIGDDRPDVAVVAPRLLNQDGTLQRSVRGFPTRWRLATEYFYLRKLGRRTELLNAFYGAGFDHESEREVECVMGACMLVRSAAIEAVGPPDPDFFLFSEEVDWLYRFARAGWTTLFTPEARCVHVGGASHGGRMYRENLKGHLRFFLKHDGEREAERVRAMLHRALVLRGRIVRGERGAMYRDAATWIASGDVVALLA
jgi:N-acetylglucosaminyl-diphospho-decaprenol L-rhamnosyltransferase